MALVSDRNINENEEFMEKGFSTYQKEVFNRGTDLIIQKLLDKPDNLDALWPVHKFNVNAGTERILSAFTSCGRNAEIISFSSSGSITAGSSRL